MRLQRAETRPLRRPVRIVSIVALFALVVVTVGVTGYALLLAHEYDAGRRTIASAFPVGERPAAATGKAAGAVNVLLLGYDVDAADPESPGTVGTRQSDTIAVIHIPADRRSIEVVSILRNAVVDIPGHGRGAINSVLAEGGSPLAVQTVEGLLHTRIDHVVQISLKGLAGLTDALGGVTITNRTAFSNDGHEFPVGTQKLDGAAALAYLRAGDFHASGDATRVAAQETYLKAVFRELVSAKTLLDPLTTSTVVRLISPYLTVDREFDSGVIANLAVSLRDVRSDDVRFVRTPSDRVGSLNGVSVVELDRGGVASLADHLHDDTMDDYAAG